MEAASFFSSWRPISAIEGHEEIESVEKKAEADGWTYHGHTGCLGEYLKFGKTHSAVHSAGLETSLPAQWLVSGLFH